MEQIAKTVSEAFLYACPTCAKEVKSTKASGRIDRRNVCGSRFYVKKGVVVQNHSRYACPHCHETVASNVVTGTVNQNKFEIFGTVCSLPFMHRCPTCKRIVQWKKEFGNVEEVRKNKLGRQCRCNQQVRTWAYLRPWLGQLDPWQSAPIEPKLPTGASENCETRGREH